MITFLTYLLLTIKFFVKFRKNSLNIRFFKIKLMGTKSTNYFLPIGEAYLIMIRNEEILKEFRDFFDQMWEISRRIVERDKKCRIKKEK